MTAPTQHAGSPPARADLQLSVVIPVYNERASILGLLDEIVHVLRPLYRFEIVCVDDASTDGSASALLQAQQQFPELTVLVHAHNQGQSAAVCNGTHRASAAWVATLDGDGQNDPADIPGLMQAREHQGARVKMLAGWRTTRRDGWSKRVASRVANGIRRRLLRDATPDTGCGIKLFERAAFLELPRFNHMHRYLPALLQRAGWQTISVPVNHRPRSAGTSKYTNLQRLWVDLFDLVGVSWLLRRQVRMGALQAVRLAAVCSMGRDSVR